MMISRIVLSLLYIQIISGQTNDQSWEDVYELVINNLQYYYRILLQPKKVLTDYTDCGVRNVAAVDVNTFTGECWESCEWEDYDPESFGGYVQYSIYTATTSASASASTTASSRNVLFNEFRKPKSWNCFFDNCFAELEEMIIRESQSNVQNNNCAARSYTEAFFTGTISTAISLTLPFDIGLKALVDCYLSIPFITSNTPGPHFSGTLNDLVVTYAITYLRKFTGTYSGTQSGRRRRKRQSEKENENKKVNNRQRRNNNEIDLVQADLNYTDLDGKFANTNITGNSFDSLGTLFRSNIIQRFAGPSVQTINQPTTSNKVRKYPWVCSLRSFGYRSFHKCGVTMLSGPSGPTILVSSAHCNFLCKDGQGNILESCCCSTIGTDGFVTNCRGSPYCTADAATYKANIDDLNIVCGEFSVQTENQFLSVEDEVILPIQEINNHPWYDPKDILKGYDIAVYVVDDTILKNATFFNKENIWPACLPKSDAEYVQPSDTRKLNFLAGWDVGDPQNRASVGFSNQQTADFIASSYHLKQMMLEEVECKDRDIKGLLTNTYYPPASKCYRDPTYMSCPNFGSSGSGLMKPFKSSGFSRYSFQGPLSFHRGCLQIFQNQLNDGKTYGNIRESFNPTLVTDARCHMPWIAANYAMRMPDDYVKPDSCNDPVGTGDKNDRNLDECLAAFPVADKPKCNFDLQEAEFGVRECIRWNSEYLTDYSYICKTNQNTYLPCPNNCRGVEANTVIVGGGSIILGSALLGSQLLAPFTIGSSLLLGMQSMDRIASNRAACPDICKLRAGGCIRGRRCQILQNSL